MTKFTCISDFFKRSIVSSITFYKLWISKNKSLQLKKLILLRDYTKMRISSLNDLESAAQSFENCQNVGKDPLLIPASYLTIFQIPKCSN